MPVMAVNDENQHEQTGDDRSRPRWSVGKKMDAVLRLLRGEPLETLSRGLGVEAHRLAAWRDDFLDGGKEALKGQRPDRSPDDRALRQAERKIGQLTMENEVLRGITDSPGFLGEPETNGCAERWIRTLKEQCLWTELHDTVEELRHAVAGFVDRYNTSWLIQRHGHQTPKEAHQAAQSVSAA